MISQLLIKKNPLILTRCDVGKAEASSKYFSEVSFTIDGEKPAISHNKGSLSTDLVILGKGVSSQLLENLKPYKSHGYS